VVRILITLTVLGAVMAVAGLAVPRLTGDDDTAERNEVASRATDFAVTANTFDYSDLDDYRTRMKSLLTADYYKIFRENSDATATVLKTNKVTLKSGKAKVLDVAIESIDEDSAETLVAVDSAIESNDAKASARRNFRWTVSLVKVKGEWLVSKFESVAAVDAEASAPAPGTPTPDATGGDDQ
jgi:hypothetical protein